MNKIKVMHVLCMSNFSGAENVAITLIDSLKDDVDSVYVSPDGSIREVVEQHGIKHYAIDKVTVPNIRKAIKAIQPDIIHAHDFTAGTVCAVAADRKIIIINHLHHNPPWIQKISPKTILYGITCFRYQKILTVSDAVMNEFVFGRSVKNKTAMIGNPINLSTVLEKSKEKLPMQKENRCGADVIFVGRLTYPKNIFLLLDVMRDLKEIHPDLAVSIVGDGELRTELEQKIIQYHMEDTITLFGFQKNPYPYLREAKVMCMPSLYEGFGLAAVEALALGKPVIAAPVGGLATIVNDTCGKLCTEKREYVLEISRLLNDFAYYEEKSRGAFTRAKQFDNIEQYKISVKKIYEDSM